MQRVLAESVGESTYSPAFSATTAISPRLLRDLLLDAYSQLVLLEGVFHVVSHECQTWIGELWQVIRQLMHCFLIIPSVNLDTNIGQKTGLVTCLDSRERVVLADTVPSAEPFAGMPRLAVAIAGSTSSTRSRSAMLRERSKGRDR